MGISREKKSKFTLSRRKMKIQYIRNCGKRLQLCEGKPRVLRVHKGKEKTSQTKNSKFTLHGPWGWVKGGERERLSQSVKHGATHL